MITVCYFQHLSEQNYQPEGTRGCFHPELWSNKQQVFPRCQHKCNRDKPVSAVGCPPRSPVCCPGDLGKIWTKMLLGESLWRFPHPGWGSLQHLLFLCLAQQEEIRPLGSIGDTLWCLAQIISQEAQALQRQLMLSQQRLVKSLQTSDRSEGTIHSLTWERSKGQGSISMLCCLLFAVTPSRGVTWVCNWPKNCKQSHDTALSWCVLKQVSTTP